MILGEKETPMNPFLTLEGDSARRKVGLVWMLNPTRMHQLFSVIREFSHFPFYFLSLQPMVALEQQDE
jgi:hypothetical protein